MEYLKTSGILKVLMVIDGDCSSVDICSGPLRYLRDQKQLCLESKYLIEVSLSDILFYDVFYFLRSSDPLNNYWFDVIRKFNKKIVYELDDNFFALQQECFRRYYEQPAVKNTVLNFLGNSDIVKYGSQALMNELSTGENSMVMPYPAPAVVKKTKSPGNDNPERIKILFASSKERRKDLTFLIPAIKSILNEFSEVQFDLIGFDEVEGLKHSRVFFHDYIFDVNRFHTYKSEMNADIGLAPLADNLSNRCKTNNKYREYAAHGIAGIYSKLPPYDSVENGKTGLVVDNDNELWYSAMKKLITDSDLRKQIIANAAADAAENYSVEKVSKEFVEKILLPLCSSEAEQEKVQIEICFLRELNVCCPIYKDTLRTIFKSMLKKAIPLKLYEKLRLIYLYRFRKT